MKAPSYRGGSGTAKFLSFSPAKTFAFLPFISLRPISGGSGGNADNFAYFTTGPMIYRCNSVFSERTKENVARVLKPPLSGERERERRSFTTAQKPQERKIL